MLQQQSFTAALLISRTTCHLVWPLQCCDFVCFANPMLVEGGEHLGCLASSLLLAPTGREQRPHESVSFFCAHPFCCVYQCDPDGLSEHVRLGCQGLAATETRCCRCKLPNAPLQIDVHHTATTVSGASQYLVVHDSHQLKAHAGDLWGHSQAVLLR